MIVLFLTLSSLSGISSAAEISVSHKLAADKLFKVMKTDKNLKQMIESMINMEIKKNPQLGLYEEVLRQFFSKHLSYDAIKDDLTQIYTNEFTEPELNKAFEFFSSPAGKKFSEKQALLFQKGALIGQKRIQNNIEELKQMIKKETERLKAMQKQPAQ